MLDWVNKLSQTYCVYPGFSISIDEMVKLFKLETFLNFFSSLTYRMKKTMKEGFKFFAMVCAWSGYCFFFFPDGVKKKRKKEYQIQLCLWFATYLIERRNNTLL